MNINEIKSTLQSGFARPNLFRVKIPSMNANENSEMVINCFQAQIPGTNILTTDRDIGLRQMSYQRAYADMMLGFYCSGDLKELAYMQQWMDTIVNKKNNHMGYYEDYTKEVEIEQLGRESNTPRQGFQFDLRARVNLGPVSLGLNTSNRTIGENKVVGRWKLEEAFPKQIDPIQLDYGTNDIYMMVTITMTYRKFTPSFGKDLLPKSNNIFPRGGVLT